MAAAAASDELHVAVALFYHAYHAVGTLDTADGFFDDHAAFVQQQRQMHTVVLQILGHGRCALTAPFLGAAAAYIHIAGRHEALCQQLFHCGQQAEQAGLGVYGAAAPNCAAVINVTAEGAVFPFAPCFHHVLMAHKHNGCVFSCALPLKQQAAVEFVLFAVGVDVGEQLFQLAVEGIELAAVGVKAGGNGFAANHFRQCLAVCFRTGTVVQDDLGGLGCGGLDEQGTHHADDEQCGKDAENHKKKFHIIAFLS